MAEKEADPITPVPTSRNGILVQKFKGNCFCADDTSLNGIDTSLNGIDTDNTVKSTKEASTNDGIAAVLTEISSSISTEVDDDNITTSFPTEDVNSNEGQELLWLEKEEENASTGKTRKRLRFFTRFRWRKGRRVQNTEKAKVLVLTTNTSQIVSPIIGNNDEKSISRRKEAAAKAESARRLLEEALSYPVESMDENEEDKRTQILMSAFSEAIEARKIMESEDEDDVELMHNKLIGEKEALESARLISVLSREGGEGRIEVETEKPDVADCSEQKTESKTLGEIILAANEHAETARCYLESMLPEFLDEAVSDSEDSEVHRKKSVSRRSKRKNKNRRNQPGKTKGQSRKDSKENGKKHDKKSGAPLTYLPASNFYRKRYKMIDHEEEEEVVDVQDINTELKRREAEKVAIIARVIQQNESLISTLGFDNTFENMTITTLNEFMDAPIFTKKGVKLPILRTQDDGSSKKNSKAKVLAIRLSSPRRRKMKQFVATMNDTEISKKDKKKLKEIENLDRLVDAAVEEKLKFPTAERKKVGVVKSDVKAPNLDSKLLKKDGRKDLADEASLDVMVKESKDEKLGDKKDAKNPRSSLFTSEKEPIMPLVELNAGERNEPPHSIAIVSSVSDPVEDRYTPLQDAEDEFHINACQGPKKPSKLVTNVAMMPPRTLCNQEENKVSSCSAGSMGKRDYDGMGSFVPSLPDTEKHEI